MMIGSQGINKNKKIGGNMQHIIDNNEIIMYNVKDIKNIFKCGLKQAYELVNSNGFPRIKIGKKILVEKKALENWIEKNKGRNIIK